MQMRFSEFLEAFARVCEKASHAPIIPKKSSLQSFPSFINKTNTGHYTSMNVTHSDELATSDSPRFLMKQLTSPNMMTRKLILTKNMSQVETTTGVKDFRAHNNFVND